MPICEACQVSFQPPEGPVEVVTTRVLCAACLAKYRAAKAARKSSAGTAVRVATPSAAPSSSPTRASAGPPVQRPASTDGAASAPPARPVPVTPATWTDRKPAERLAAPASKQPAAVPRSSPAKSSREAPPKKKSSRDDEFIQRETEALRKRENRTVWIGGVLALLMLGIAGAVVYVVLGKKTEEHNAQVAHENEVKDFQAAFMAVDITTEEGCKAAIARADEKRGLWESEDIAPEIQSRYAKANTTLVRIQERKSLLERLAKVEETLKDPSASTADSLAETRRVIDELDAEAGIVGGEFIARLGAARSTADRSYAARLLDEARSSASSEGGRPALAKFSRAEEEIYRILEKTFKAKDKEGQAFYQEQYQAAIRESDAVCARVFNEGAIEATPWRDLLSNEEAPNWHAAALQGFEHRIENGTLHIIGPSPEAGARGIISIGDTENWRDFVLDCEFTILQGSFEMHFRLGPSLEDKIELIEYGVGEDDRYRKNAGELYQVSVSLVGSTFNWVDEGQPDIRSSRWDYRRKGAIGIVVPEGTEVRFTRIRIRLLR